MQKIFGRLAVVSVLFFLSISLSSLESFASADSTQPPNQLWIGELNQSTLSISSESLTLGTEFLFRSSFIPQFDLASSQGLLSRIVYFRRDGNRVLMMESTQGHLASQSLPASMILASLPILTENENRVIVDFNQGMAKVFLAGGWHVSDWIGRHYDPGTRSQAALVEHSFIKDSFTREDTIQTHQIVQLNIGDTYFPSFEARYYLSPYQPNSNFYSKENLGFRNFGFFETPPQLEPGTGRNNVFITRFSLPENSENKIKYFISANTPPEYVEAVREGILYWNKAFGKDVLQAELAPMGMTAPDAKMNMVQWIDWDRAGMAYADALSDPRTGEILNTQVYLTSVFAFSSRQQLRKILRDVRGLLEQTSDKSGDSSVFENQSTLSQLKNRRLADNGHGKHKHLCHMKVNHQLINALEEIAEHETDDAALLRLSQDYVRDVVAHEVGHTLGLRHNFLGKTALNVSLEERDQSFMNYLTKGELPAESLVVTSSVMDYLNLKDSVISGTRIVRNLPAGEHDRLALQWGYAPSKEKEPVIDQKTVPLFGTDSHLLSHYDVDLFTSGAQPIVDAVREQKRLLAGVANDILERFIAAKAPHHPRDAVDLELLALSTFSHLYNTAVNMLRAVPWMQNDTRALAVERRFPYVSQVNFEAVRVAQWQLVADQIEKAGGVEAAFFPHNARLREGKTILDAETLLKQLDHRLEILRKNGFVGADGKLHRFTENEETLIRDRARSYIDHLNIALTDLMVDVFLNYKIDYEAVSKNGYLSTDDLSVTFEKKLAEMAEAILTLEAKHTPDGKGVLIGEHKLSNGHTPKILVHRYVYPFSLRLKAAKLLSEDRGHSQAWSLDGRRNILRKLVDSLSRSVGADWNEVKVNDLTPPVRDWFLEQSKLIQTIQTGFGCDDIIKSGSHKDKNEEKQTGLK